MYVYKRFWLERGKRKKKEWVGNSFKTIVLTAAKDIDPSYCSQCGHMAEGLGIAVQRQHDKILLFVA